MIVKQILLVNDKGNIQRTSMENMHTDIKV